MALKHPKDLLGEVCEDHLQIKQMLSQVQSAHGAARQAAFNTLLKKLAIHETAEEMVVHPLGRKAPGGDQTVEQRLAEERKAESVLIRLQHLDVESSEFERTFTGLKKDVLAHAESEEQKEHPKIRQTVSLEKLQELAGIYRAAEAVAPTRPHPDGSKSALGTMLITPIASIIDRTRDLVRDALKDQKS